MKNSYEDALFIIPIVAIFAIGIALHYITKSDQPEASNTNLMSGLVSVQAESFDNYAMLEPFAENPPFNFANVMQQPMNPAAWMHWMNNMMNYMSMTQMMHQMAAMPMQMMSPNLWMDPYAKLSNHTMGTVQQPMSPEEYKKWYDQYHSHLEANK